MGLITTSDLATYMNKTFDAGQLAQASYLIDSVSAYVENYTGLSFAVVTDDVVKVQADYAGVVTLAGEDVQEPTYVKSVILDENVGGSEVSSGYVYWDGYDTLYNCMPYQWLEVTYTHGNANIPRDLQGVVTECCATMLNNFKKLAAKTIGATTEVYGYVTNNDIEQYLSGLAMETLDSYKPRETSFRLGPRTFPYE